MSGFVSLVLVLVLSRLTVSDSSSQCLSLALDSSPTDVRSCVPDKYCFYKVSSERDKRYELFGCDHQLSENGTSQMQLAAGNVTIESQCDESASVFCLCLAGPPRKAKEQEKPEYCNSQWIKEWTHAPFADHDIIWIYAALLVYLTTFALIMNFVNTASNQRMAAEYAPLPRRWKMVCITLVTSQVFMALHFLGESVLIWYPYYEHCPSQTVSSRGRLVAQYVFAFQKVDAIAPSTTLFYYPAVGPTLMRVFILCKPWCFMMYCVRIWFFISQVFVHRSKMESCWKTLGVPVLAFLLSQCALWWDALERTICGVVRSRALVALLMLFSFDLWLVIEMALSAAVLLCYAAVFLRSATEDNHQLSGVSIDHLGHDEGLSVLPSLAPAKENDLFIDPLPFVIKAGTGTLSFLNGFKSDYLAVRILTRSEALTATPMHMLLPPRKKLSLKVVVDKENPPTEAADNMLLVEYFNTGEHLPTLDPKSLWKKPMTPAKWKFKFVLVLYENSQI